MADTIARSIKRLEAIEKSLARDPTDGGRTPEGLKLHALIAELRGTDGLGIGKYQHWPSGCGAERDCPCRIKAAQEVRGSTA